MADISVPAGRAARRLWPAGPAAKPARRAFHRSAAKRGFDIAVCLALLPMLALAALIVALLNPAVNPGPVFFVQARMGRGCVPFAAVKFRTMRPGNGARRLPEGPLEVARITRLGRAMRRARLDELPQILNVLAGQMSLIGPRPDCLDHARHFLRTVPGYRARHAVRPGISGLAQTEIGYVAGSHATRRKVLADLYYIRHSSLRLEAWLIWRTLSVVARRQGA